MTQENCKYALDLLPFCRAIVIQEYVKTFKLEDLYSPDYIYNLAIKELNGGKVLDAANMIIKFEIYDRFDIKDIIIQLVEETNGCTSQVKLLLNKKPEILPEIVKKLSTPKSFKLAMRIV